jgi:hypothetical protein
LVLPDQFDRMAVVVDWLDACRNRNLQALLDLHADDASLECRCEGIVVSGRAQLAAYWAPRLYSLAPTAFGLDEIIPLDDGVTLDYLDFEGKPVRVVFGFGSSGKITHARCQPLPG